MKKNRSLKKEGAKVAPEPNPAPALAQIEIKYDNVYLLNGSQLEPYSAYDKDALKNSGQKAIEKKFKSQTELAELVLTNGELLFGEKTILLDCAKKNSISLPGSYIPHGLLIDLRELEKPRLHIIEIILSKVSMAQLSYRMTCIFSLFRNQESTKQFLTILDEAIRRNIRWRDKIKVAFGEKLIYGLLQLMLTRKPSVLLVMDSFKEELTGFMQTYTETWGKLIKPVLVRKFIIGEDTLVTVVPSFEELSNKECNKKEVKAKETEGDHLEVASETVQNIYRDIKRELLAWDSTLEFKVKKFYIALRNRRNVAFFQLGKTKLSIILARPESDTIEKIKYHQKRTLAESVKRFWNGNEHCFTVQIENKENLEEIVNLLKKMANPEKAKETTPEVVPPKVEDDNRIEPKAPPKAKEKTKTTKPHGKPKKVKKK